MRATYLLMCLMLGAGPVGAQVVRGVVVDAQSGEPVTGVSVSLVPSDTTLETRRVVSDRDGLFRLAAPKWGRYRLAAEREGYLRSQSREMRLAMADSLHVVQRISADAVVLEPLRVVARRRMFSRRLESFYRRQERGFPGAWVRTREQILQEQPILATNLLSSARGLRLRVYPGQRGYGIVGRGGCSPRVFLDGLPISGGEIDEWVTPYALLGVEVYPYPELAPAEYAGRADCAVVLLWTRTMEEDW